MKSALSHIKVLDLSRVFAGPWATQNLADLGAEVIKIERPGRGDDTRAWGPPFLKDQNGQETRDSSYFLSVNRGKKSVTVDISTAEGQEIIREIAKDVDVVIENYKVGTLARYGLAWDDLKKINPRLIYCSITGFGQTGPLADLPGYDFVFQGMGGLMSMTGQPDHAPGGEPMKVGIAISDLTTGMYATTAILAAIENRRVSGEGQYIDLSLLDCTVALTSYMAINYFLSGKVPQRQGNAHTNMVPYQVFKCKDGNIIIAVGNDSQFVSLCTVLGIPEIGTDERFSTPGQRNRNRETLIPMLSEILMSKTMDEWVGMLESANVPCGPIYNLAQVFEQKQVKHRELLLSLPHSAGVQAPAVASPIKFSGTPIQYTQSAPQLGEHNAEILEGRLGFSEEKLKSLKDKGII